MNTKKKIISICLAVCLIAIAVTGFSLAYFTDNDSKTNTFTVGNVDIELVEPTWERNPNYVASSDDANGGLTNVQPGVAYTKDPTVNNIGANDAWIRVNVKLTSASAFKAAAKEHGITDLSTVFGGHDESKWTRASITEDEDADTITYSYLFNEIVVPGASTGALFTTVTIPGAFTSAEMEAIGNFEIIITADAIQAAGFDTPAAAFTEFDAVA